MISIKILKRAIWVSKLHVLLYNSFILQDLARISDKGCNQVWWEHVAILYCCTPMHKLLASQFPSGQYTQKSNLCWDFQNMKVLEELSPYLGYNSFHSLSVWCVHCDYMGWKYWGIQKKFNHQIRYLIKGLGLLFTRSPG